MSKKLILCDCLGSFPINAEALGATGAMGAAPLCTALCTTQLDRAAAALEQGDALFCCAQEAPRFEALAEEMDLPAPPVVDLRDRAGWSADPASKLPKMSALLAEAQMPMTPTKSLDVISEGICLIVGPADVALHAAQELKDFLSVTVLLPASTAPDDLPQLPGGFDLICGSLRRAEGALGQFRVTIDALQQVEPGGRGTLALSMPRDGGHSECDVLLDLSGAQPLFPAPEKREGYLRADPAHPPSVAKAVLAASHLIGTFEKPLYVRVETDMCAHSRAEQSGCSRCLNLCPTGAIQPAGAHVTVDPMICAGCGACSSVCPSGAISYDAPAVSDTMRRVQTLAQAYLAAQGPKDSVPRLLVHDAHGSEMIRLSARYGQGLPAHVIPMEMPAIGAFGHAEALAALAAGFAHVTVMPGPGADRDALEGELALTQAIAGSARAALLDSTDPDHMSEALYQASPDQSAPVHAPVRPMGTRRQITRQAARALQPEAEQIDLPQGAPYGAVLVDTDSCTLCLSCVSLCPSGALGDNPDKPQLRFQEDACLQCGLCAQVCPEEAITLEPRLDLTPAALRQEVLNEEEPFACISCGALFGSKSAIDRIMEKLSGHSMFADPDKLKMLQMCDTCRVTAQVHSSDNPFAGGERPRLRTTDDYFSARKDH